jgi:sugar phosphate isomerase/epimerase
MATSSWNPHEITDVIHSAATISLVPQAKGGPFLFRDDLSATCAKAAALGFAAVEIFAPSAEDLDARRLESLLRQHQLKLAALGTGAGWILRKLRLTDPDLGIRTQARQFVAGLIELASRFGAPTIIGSIQGRSDGDVTREQALGWLREALEELGARAEAGKASLLIEPLNRYETNLLNSVTDGVKLIESLRTRNVKLLCDLFHMNIEEVSIADALQRAGPHLGHVHWVDSNRCAAGLGHIDYAPIAQVLRDIRYDGYVSAEALPFPDPETAAKQTIASYRKFLALPQG